MFNPSPSDHDALDSIIFNSLNNDSDLKTNIDLLDVSDETKDWVYDTVVNQKFSITPKLI